LQLTQKYYEGRVPECGELNDYDKETLAEFQDVKARLEQLLEGFKFREAQKEAMNLARIGNKYIADCEPWKVVKTDPERVKTIINLSLQITANLAIAFEPFLPFSSKRLREMIALDTFSWEDLGRTDIMVAGRELPKPELLFTKIEDEVVAAQKKKLEDVVKQNEAAAYKAAPVKPTVSFEDFEKLDIRVGLVKSCEKIKKSKKLLKFTLDDGSGKDRTILSGIAQWYEPEQLVGKRVLFIANFAPRQMMGEESQGMILSAVNYNGDLSVTTTIDDVKGGSQVG
jgi:methionyl-tRNA synthetase